MFSLRFGASLRKNTPVRFVQYGLSAIVLILLIGAQTGRAQNIRGIEIAPFYGYQYGGQFTVYDGEINIVDADNFGIVISAPVPYKPGLRTELFYSRQETTLEYREYSYSEADALFDIIVEYFHAGAQMEQKLNDKVFPFGTITLGATHFNPRGSAIDSEWRFSFSLGLGTKIFFNDRIGLRAQARLLMPFQFTTGGIFVSPEGTAIGLSGGSAILQGDVTAGLIFRI
jgi:opacity protein-like surface antigen